MKNVLTFLIVVSILSSYSFSQTAKVDEALIITDGAGGTQTIYFGLDSAATDGIDLYLGEASLPPLPPSGIFDVRFNLPGGTDASLKDYRQAGVPDTAYSGETIHEIQYQVGSGTTIKIDWDLPADSSIMGRLQDVVLGTLIDTQMVGTGSYTITNPGAFNKLKLTVTYIETVPVELASFTATIENGVVTLNWETATEINNRGFEVERSLSQTLSEREGLSNWETIGFVQGYGNSTSTKYYSFTDSKLLGGNKFQYRLKQSDYNGKYEYSKIVVIEIFLNKFSLNQNYPNPFNPSTTIKYAISSQQHVMLKVYNLLGNEAATLVNEVKPAGVYEVKLDAANMPSGVYFYKLQAGTFIGIKKMTLLR